MHSPTTSATPTAVFPLTLSFGQFPGETSSGVQLALYYHHTTSVCPPQTHAPSLAPALTTTVSANVVAKPTLTHTPAVADNGSIYLASELSTTSHKDIPPSYATAVNNAVPPYWETTIHTPPDSGDPEADIIIDDLPIGGPWLFMTNLVVSFLFTYLLHVSRAAGYGSRAGLGLMLIQLGFCSRSPSASDTAPADPLPIGMNQTMTTTTFPPDPTQLNPGLSITSRDWLAFLLMTVG
ncbi:hypothetical protein DXG01_017186 [Tephrocybe rancida]|nr:hypothetical protein DXG01_017186 [Tephrocybe rancida]